MVGTIGPATSDYCAAEQTSAADVDGNRPSDALRTAISCGSVEPWIVEARASAPISDCAALQEKTQLMPRPQIAK